MGDVLSADEFVRAVYEGKNELRVCDSHEALRAQLAAAEEQARLANIDWMNELHARNAAEERAAQARHDFYERDLPQMQRLAMWLDPDPDLPLPNLDRLVDGAMEREAKALDALRAAEERAAEQQQRAEMYLAAHDALVAERDQAIAERDGAGVRWTDALVALNDAEAKVRTLREALTDVLATATGLSDFVEARKRARRVLRQTAALGENNDE